MEKEEIIKELEPYWWEEHSSRHHPITEHNLDIQSVFKLGKENAKLSNKELICIECGFCTYGYKDMVEHLSQYVEEKDDRIPEENCTTKRIKLGKKRLNDLG